MTPDKFFPAGGTTAANAHVFKASPGQLYFLGGFNTNASARYLHVYDKAVAPAVGTDVPRWTFALPPNAAGSPFTPAIPPQGVEFTAGIAVAFTNGPLDTDTSVTGANECCVCVGYK
jgi:hypothetical protein